MPVYVAFLRVHAPKCVAEARIDHVTGHHVTVKGG